MTAGRFKTICNLYSTVNVCPVTTAKGIYCIIGNLQFPGVIPMNSHNTETEVRFIISESLARKLWLRDFEDLAYYTTAGIFKYM